jgi:hypothetical protein
MRFLGGTAPSKRCHEGCKVLQEVGSEVGDVEDEGINDSNGSKDSSVFTDNL